MKKNALRILVFSFLFPLSTFLSSAQRQVDEFTTKSGKKVTITCIKHACMEINFDGV